MKRLLAVAALTAALLTGCCGHGSRTNRCWIEHPSAEVLCGNVKNMPAGSTLLPY